MIAEIVKDRGVQHRRIGMEERVRFFIADGVRKRTPGMEIVDATPVTAGCRIYKSQGGDRADAARERRRRSKPTGRRWPRLREGMTQDELSANIVAAFPALGFRGGVERAVRQVDRAAARQRTPQRLREGDIVMIDGGSSVRGVSVGHHAHDRVRQADASARSTCGNIEKRAQAAAFKAMKIGATCESVDAAARKVIVNAGFGPGYKVPGLPHRTGHGIGLDGHEWTNFVKGNKTPIRRACASATSR